MNYCYFSSCISNWPSALTTGIWWPENDKQMFYDVYNNCKMNKPIAIDGCFSIATDYNSMLDPLHCTILWLPQNGNTPEHHLNTLLGPWCIQSDGGQRDLPQCLAFQVQQQQILWDPGGDHYLLSGCNSFHCLVDLKISQVVLYCWGAYNQILTKQVIYHSSTVTYRASLLVPLLLPW